MKYDFLYSAEMDAPISIIDLHPYGRRRVGVNEQLGASAQFLEVKYSLFFITNQIYKLN
jgi:hypothetical protein